MIRRHKVTLCMIVKDEEISIPRIVESVRKIIDGWVIVDTGSTDHTMEVVHDVLGDLPGELHERPWVNFGHNRTELLELAREFTTAGYFLLPDADDELVIEATLPVLKADCYNIRYNTGNMEWYFPRLVRASKPWYYVGPAHSYMDCREPFTQDNLTQAYFLHHHHDTGKDRGNKFKRDEELFAKAVQEDPTDSRSWFYLAQSIRDQDHYQLAATVYEHRARMGGWPEEVFYAMYQVGVLRRDPEWLWRSWDYRPERAEPLYWLARIARENGRYADAMEYAKRGLEIPYPATDKLFVHKWIYDVGFHQEIDLAGAPRIGLDKSPASD